MFTTPCFIRKNTPELRLYLEILGYEHQKENVLPEDIVGLYVDNKGYLLEDEYAVFHIYPHIVINCFENIELFKAIAALRNDTDYMQWFVTDDGLDKYLGYERYLKGEFFLSTVQNVFDNYDYSFKFHKATVEELIEHFK